MGRSNWCERERESQSERERWGVDLRQERPGHWHLPRMGSPAFSMLFWFGTLTELRVTSIMHLQRPSRSMAIECKLQRMKTVMKVRIPQTHATMQPPKMQRSTSLQLLSENHCAEMCQDARDGWGLGSQRHDKGRQGPVNNQQHQRGLGIRKWHCDSRDLEAVMKLDHATCQFAVCSRQDG